MTKLVVGFNLFVVCLFGLLPATTLADTSTSTHYVFQETALGGVGTNGVQGVPQSASFQLGASSGGILGFGTSASATLQVKAGNTTTKDPALSFGVLTPNVSLGQFSPTATATATSSFEVLDYTSFGYVVQVTGNSLSDGGYTIPAMATTDIARTGHEQFGINMVSNTTPAVGANPNNGQFGYGSVNGTNYGTANNFRYVSGEDIALAPQSSGDTIYTISYIVNVSGLTPAGQYSSNQIIICTATY